MGQRQDDRTIALITSLTEQGAEEPGVAVSVIRGGDVVARRYVGLASLEHRIPIGPETRFHIVSVSKTFIAAAVLVLAARGAVRLDDPIRRYIPELPAEVAVTIRHLLSMTSGLGDVLEIERLLGVWTSSPSRTRDLALLLDELIARVSGMPADACRRAALYEPLGLTATGARPHEGVVVPDLAEPYVPDGRGGCSAPSYAPEALDAFTGRYENQEIGSRHSVRVQDGTLSIEYGLGADRGLRFPMEPIAPDIFLVRPTAPGVAYRHVFRFERDADGTVVSAIVTMERLKGLRLSRV